MREEILRTAMLLGEEAVNRLQNTRATVFGIGAIDLINNDDISLSNINRQILASHSTMGMAKVEAGKQQWGYEAIIGAVIVGSISEGLLGLFAKYRRSIISPIISACVVIAIIMNLIIPKDSDD